MGYGYYRSSYDIAFLNAGKIPPWEENKKKKRNKSVQELMREQEGKGYHPRRSLKLVTNGEVVVRGKY